MRNEIDSKRNIPHIQVLRGLAVLVVILFHLGIPFFKAGFLGVDLFFVISGFFMFQIYSNSKTKPRALQFYRRRLSRILPTFLLIYSATQISSLLILLPHERLAILRHSLTDLTFVSNIHFWLGTQYFSSGELRPTLSFWSLALELQFYLFFPLLYQLLIRKYRYFISLMITSLAVYLFLNFISPQSAFFLLPGRFWQFGLGVLAGYWLIKSPSIESSRGQNNSKYFNFFFASVLVLMSLPNFVPSINSGLLTVAFTFFATFLVYFASANIQLKSYQGFLAKIGDASYSLYLVHLPLITFINYEPFGGNGVPDNTLEAFLSLAIVFIIGFSVYNLFEKPIRNCELKGFLSLSFSLVLISTISANVFISKLSTSFVNDDIARISMAAEDRTEFRCGTFDRINFIRNIQDRGGSCSITSNGHYRYLLVGNSHADTIKTALARKLENLDVSLFLFRDNLALSELNLATVLREAARLEVQSVVVHSSAGATDLTTLGKLSLSLRQIGVNLIVIGPIPTFSTSVPKAMIQEVIYGKTAPNSFRQDLENVGFREDVWLFHSANFKYRYIDAESIFCKNECLISSNSGHPYYFDDNHLTLTGSYYLLDSIPNSLLAIGN